MLQNLLCLRKKKTHVFFFVFHFSMQLSFYPYECRSLYRIDQGIHKGKMKVALNEKRKKLHDQEPLFSEECSTI